MASRRRRWRNNWPLMFVAGWRCIGMTSWVFVWVKKPPVIMLVLALLPDHAGHAVAKQLMQRFQTWLLAQGHDTLCLLTTADPQPRACGFLPTPGLATHQ
ncbi:GNAT family N-acetyltransferase [Marinicella meishanensis]|uniref:GNAT family N-acetyltransferase n=1 Tax=Marinicella meishanensis TaxID=2873263 RepID=UPI001CC07CDB